MNKTEWVFFALPESGMLAAGIDFTLYADVTDIKNNKASYQWYRDGFELYGMNGDTLILKNITQDYAGRYTVAITLNNTSALFSCIIEVIGTTTGRTTIESKNTALAHVIKPVEPEPEPEPKPTKYDTVKVTDSKGKELTNAFDITEMPKSQVIQLGFPKQPDEYTYVFYTKKLAEIYKEYKTGAFRINLNGGGYFDVPFDFINSINNKDIDLTKDHQLKITVNEKNEYIYLYFTIITEDNKVLIDNNLSTLPGVYMYLPIPEKLKNKDYMIIAENSSNLYPVTSKKEGEMLKFKVTTNFVYYIDFANPPEFGDIKNHWGEKDIIKSAGNFLVKGYPDGSYKPEGILTRAEFTAMLFRALYHRFAEEVAQTKVYSDVTNDDWFSTYIRNADIMGLTGFITGDEFKPDREITREEMAYMIAKALDYAEIYYPVPATPPAIKYSDKDEINERYGQSVEICTNMKLLQGSEGYFKPKDGLTRAEAATVLNRLMNLMAENI